MIARTLKAFTLWEFLRANVLLIALAFVYVVLASGWQMVMRTGVVE